MKFSIFASEKNLCILHGQVSVMFHFINLGTEKQSDITVFDDDQTKIFWRSMLRVHFSTAIT